MNKKIISPIILLFLVFNFSCKERINTELSNKLSKVYKDDQKYRLQHDEIEKKFGFESEEIIELWKKISKQDSINQAIVINILDEYGWLGKDKIGWKGNLALFLVIQHADMEIQKKYLPMMRDAVKIGNANSSALALLEDRLALRQGNKQIFGSQIAKDPETNLFFVAPLIDPENVDERRKEVGLPKISVYVSRWGIEWNANEYIKQSAEIDAVYAKSLIEQEKFLNKLH